MLLKTHISNISHGSEDWVQVRSSRFTSSEIHFLCDKEGIGKGGMSYIYRKVGEHISGVPIRKEIDTEATVWGNIYEPEAIRKYGRKHNLEFLITQKLIFDPNGRFSSTPDFLEVESETEEKEGYNVTTGEVKCPLTYDAFIALCLCDTPADVKKTEKKYYWQTLDEMENCGSVKGKLVIYHPHFGEHSLKEIVFRKFEKIDGIRVLENEMIFLNQRKNEALIKFEEIKKKLTLK